MAVDANSKQIIFKSAQRSKIVRENFDDKDAEVNDLQAQINGLITAPAGNEVTNARDYHVVLRDRLRSVSQGHENQIIDGFDVLEQATPDMTIKVKAGDGIVDGVGVIKGFGTWTRSTATITITELNHGLSNGNNIYVDVTSSAPALPATAEYTVANAATDTFDITGVAAGDTTGTAQYSRYSATITAPTNKRWDIVVIDSGNTISILSGNDSNDRVFPAVASTQRPIALIDLDSATATITDSLITDISKQGCLTGNKWFFKIQDAIDSLNDRTQIVEQGTIFIKKGDYYEEINLTGKNNISLIFENGAKIYRTDNAAYCIKSINTVSNETIGIKIINGDFYGNGKAGAIELLKFEYTDEFTIKDCRFDSNNLSTATNKNWLINQCDNFYLDHNLNLDNSDDIDYSETDITNATNYQEDGYYKNQVTMCGVTAEKAQMLKMGWSELTAMDDKFLRIDKDTAGATGGADTKDIEHVHAWFTPYSDKDTHDTTYNASGIETDIDLKNYSVGTGGAIAGSLKGIVALNFSGASGDAPAYTDPQGSTTQDVKPAYYTLIALIHR